MPDTTATNPPATGTAAAGTVAAGTVAAGTVAADSVASDDSDSSEPWSVTCIVNITDGVDTTVEAFFLELQETDIDDEKLSDLRELIVRETRCVEILQLPFCLATGAVVQDTVSVDYYLTTCLKTDATDGRIEVYLKNDQPNADKGWNDMVHGAYSSPLTGTNARHISELEEKQWNVVIETNQLCYASSAITQKVKKTVAGKEKEETVVVGVQKSRNPAFRLATRKILSDTLASSMVKNVELDLRIPRHINDDPSYVSMRYSTSAAEKSLAKSGFTQTDISASGGGGAFGFSVDVSASLSLSKETSEATATASSKSDVTISYNFPRVTVYLDESGLELTTQCEADLREIRDAASYYKFIKKYGEFFSTTVQLGGELFATETAEENSDASREATANSMRAAAAASLSGWGFSASVSASHQTQSTQASAASTQSSSRALIWQANGGNTLLCNNAAAWAPSVAYYGNWRVIKQGNVVRIMDLISKMKGFEYVRASLAVWKTTGPVVDPPISQKFTLNVKSTTSANARYLLGDKQHYGFGDIGIGPKSENKTIRYLVWELALAEGGGVATKVEYGVDYYLLHRESNLYPGLYDLKREPRSDRRLVRMYDRELKMEAVGVARPPVHIIHGIRTRDYIVRFCNDQDKSKTGNVQNGDTVTLEFWQDSAAIGHLAEYSTHEANTSLVVTKRTTGYTAMKLTYTEVTEAELKAANEVKPKANKITADDEDYEEDYELDLDE